MRKHTRQGNSTRGQSSSSHERTIEEKEFFASFEFDSVACRYDPENLGVSFRLGGDLKTVSLLKLGSRDGEFVMGGMAVKKVRDSRIRLAYRCITTTILGREDSTQRITTIDLFCLYCIYGEGATCNIPDWLAWYLERVKDKDLICGGMFVTSIARSLRLLTNSMVDALSVEPQVREDDEVREAANEGAGGSADMHQLMTWGDWQVIFDEKKPWSSLEFHWTTLG
uniref:Uncharacterized protein n=1 Tax=Tanacetum cinerariifolium TaxID=118510 RepID=A0A699GPN6_TANCI|nr:hypothetical protein [Tanacetum cinerariifolium]